LISNSQQIIDSSGEIHLRKFLYVIELRGAVAKVQDALFGEWLRKRIKEVNEMKRVFGKQAFG
jgi:hypothetical protein